jgi:hypothetical protein
MSTEQDAMCYTEYGESIAVAKDEIDSQKDSILLLGKRVEKQS